MNIPKLSAKLRAIVVTSVALVCFSCSMDYGKDIEAKALDRSVPDMIILDSQARIVRDDQLVMVLDADRLETFSEAGNQILVGVRFTQYSRDGAVTARGTAGRAVRIIQSDNVQFTEGLVVEVVGESAKIKADSLDWTADDKVLRGKPDEAVEITKDNGSRITGFGLYADLSGRTIELSGGVGGVIIND